MAAEGDQQVMDAIQARFEVAMTELPDNIDPSSYSELHFTVLISPRVLNALIVSSDLVILFVMLSECIPC